MKIALVLSTFVSVLSPIAVHADQTSSQTTQIVGTFNPVTLNVTIPATTTFTYSADYVSMTAQAIDVANHSQAPVYMNVQQIAVSPTSAWKPSLVSPTSETDWTNLTKAQTMSKVALGLDAINCGSWLNGIENNDFGSTDLSSPVKVGAIKSFGIASVQPTLKAGIAIDTQAILTTNYVFEFGIE